MSKKWGPPHLLNYFQQELQEIYKGAEGHYIIRYYPDPESTFDGILRRIFQEFDAQNLLIKLADYLASLSEPERDAAISIASSHEMRAVTKALMKATSGTDDQRADLTKAALEWLTGLRILKRHRDLLGVNFRLDTVESKTQALRDLVFCCSKAELLNGLYLLLDELEKQDYSYSKAVVLRYLSAIRALIDALPKHLFLLVALTIESRRRYFSWLPAFAGRLQNIVRIDPIKTPDAALRISDFYVAQARADARREFGVVKNKVEDLIPKSEIQDMFTTSAGISREGSGRRYSPRSSKCPSCSRRKHDLVDLRLIFSGVRMANLDKTPFDVIDCRLTATNKALDEASRSISQRRGDNITRRDIENGLMAVLGLDEIFDLLDRDIDSAEIMALLADCDFARLRPITICELLFEESIVPLGVPISLTEAEVKLKGEIWTVHKYDADPFPSNPHAHCYAQRLKLHLGDGSLYQNMSKTSCGNIGKKTLLKLRDLIMQKNGTILLPVLEV